MSGCGCACGSADKSGVVATKQILEALAQADRPFGTKDLVEATGLDKGVVSAEMTKLKKQGLVESPVRCKYGITSAGKASLA